MYGGILGRLSTSSAVKVTGTSAKLSPLVTRTVGNANRTALALRWKSSSSDGFEELDKPIKFTTSKASDWNAQQTFTGTLRPDTPWIQPWAVLFSTAAFLIYFLVLREENDLDEEMRKPLWQRIPGLELQQLQTVYDYNKEHGLDNTEVLARIRELEAEEREKALFAATAGVVQPKN